MRIGARITNGIWVSIPFTFMGFMMGGWIVAMFLFFASLFLLPAFISDLLKEEQGKAMIKVCGVRYMLVGLYGPFFEPMTVATSVGYRYTGWHLVSTISLS